MEQGIILLRNYSLSRMLSCILAYVFIGLYIVPYILSHTPSFHELVHHITSSITSSITALGLSIAIVTTLFIAIYVYLLSASYAMKSVEPKIFSTPHTLIIWGYIGAFIASSMLVVFLLINSLRSFITGVFLKAILSLTIPLITLLILMGLLGEVMLLSGVHRVTGEGLYQVSAILASTGTILFIAMLYFGYYGPGPTLPVLETVIISMLAILFGYTILSIASNATLSRMRAGLHGTGRGG